MFDSERMCSVHMVLSPGKLLDSVPLIPVCHGNPHITPSTRRATLEDEVDEAHIDTCNARARGRLQAEFSTMIQNLMFRFPYWRFTASLFLVLAMSGARGQDLRYFGFDSWSTEQGLPQNSVHSIEQTSDGYIWVATEGGLARFDGIRFKTFQKQTDPAFRSNDICCLLAGHAGDLWIGTSDGLLHLQKGQFTRYSETSGLPSSTITGLADVDDGHLQVTTTSGSTVWPKSVDAALGRRSHDETRPSSYPDAAVTLPRTWSWTATEVQVHQAALTQTWHVGHQLPAGRVSTLHVDRDGLAWVGMNRGLLVVDAEKHAVTPVALLSGSSILSVFQDREGNYWVGTESSGLHLLRRRRFRSIPALAEQAVTSVTQSKDGALWVGTKEDGLYYSTAAHAADGIWLHALNGAAVLCLQPALEGGVWAGTPDGLNYVDERHTFRLTLADGLPDDYVRSLATAQDGTVWIGTRHGLARLHGTQIRTFTAADGLGGDLIGAMMLDQPQAGRELVGLWVTTSGGLSHISGDGAIQTFSTSAGLKGQIVTALARDTLHRLWVATENGAIGTFDNKGFQQAFRLPLEMGGDDLVQAMLFDASNSLWLRRDRGMIRMDASHISKCLQATPCALPDDAIVTYGRGDGLRNDEAVPRATSIPWLTASGELWIPTRSGVSVANTGSRDNTVGPAVDLQRLLLDDTVVDFAHGTPQIPFGQQRITMEYAGLSFIASSTIHYRYRLQGFEKDWVEASTRRFATYTNLSPGSYRFDVEARNNDGDWSPQAARLDFTIIPPVYRRWWFLLLAALVTATAIFEIYRLRVRRIRGRFDAILAERNRIARDIHDTLTQDFVSTCVQLDIVAQYLQKEDVEKALSQVRRARQMVTDGLAEARQSIWELRSNHLHDTLPVKLARLTERDTFMLKARLRVHGAYRAMDDGVEREVLRLANESLMNVSRHARAQHIEIELVYLEKEARLTIEDDGIGFDLEKALRMERHYGLLGMKERAATINAVLDISTQTGRGTIVTLTVPVTSVREEKL